MNATKRTDDRTLAALLLPLLLVAACGEVKTEPYDEGGTRIVNSTLLLHENYPRSAGLNLFHRALEFSVPLKRLVQPMPLSLVYDDTRGAAGKGRATGTYWSTNLDWEILGACGTDVVVRLYRPGRGIKVMRRRDNIQNTNGDNVRVYTPSLQDGFVNDGSRLHAEREGGVDYLVYKESGLKSVFYFKEFAGQGKLLVKIKEYGLPGVLAQEVNIVRHTAGNVAGKIDYVYRVGSGEYARFVYDANGVISQVSDHGWFTGRERPAGLQEKASGELVYEITTAQLGGGTGPRQVTAVKVAGPPESGNPTKEVVTLGYFRDNRLTLVGWGSENQGGTLRARDGYEFVRASTGFEVEEVRYFLNHAERGQTGAGQYGLRNRAHRYATLQKSGAGPTVVTYIWYLPSGSAIHFEQYTYAGPNGILATKVEVSGEQTIETVRHSIDYPNIPGRITFVSGEGDQARRRTLVLTWDLDRGVVRKRQVEKRVGEMTRLYTMWEVTHWHDNELTALNMYPRKVKSYGVVTRYDRGNSWPFMLTGSTPEEFEGTTVAIASSQSGGGFLTEMRVNGGYVGGVLRDGQGRILEERLDAGGTHKAVYTRDAAHFGAVSAVSLPNDVNYAITNHDTLHVPISVTVSNGGGQQLLPASSFSYSTAGGGYLQSSRRQLAAGGGNLLEESSITYSTGMPNTVAIGFAGASSTTSPAVRMTFAYQNFSFLQGIQVQVGNVTQWLGQRNQTSVE